MSEIKFPPGAGLEPYFQSTFESRIHSDASTVIANSQKYFVENGPWKNKAQMEQYLRGGSEEIAMMTLPGALPDRIETIAKWYAWGFILDDLIESMSVDEVAKLEYLMNLILGRALPDRKDGLGSITFDVHANFLGVEEKRNKEFGQDVRQSMIRWAKRTFAERQSRLGGQTTKDCQDHRLDSVGSYGVWPAIRWACDIPLSPEVLNDLEMLRLEDIAHRHTMYINDLYSYRKEKATARKLGWSEARFCLENSVAAAMRGNRSSEEEAMDHIVGVWKDWSMSFRTVSKGYLLSIKDRLGRISVDMLKL